MNYENTYKLLEEKGQLHLLKYYDTLSEAEQAALLNQISEIDFSLIDMAIWHWSSWQVVRAPVLDSPVLREPSTSVSPSICLYSSFSSSTPSIL